MGALIIINNISKIIVLLILSLLISMPYVNILAKKQKINDSICYGFVVPLPQGKDTTLETFETSKVMNAINDLLRSNISVYWSKEDFCALSKKIDSNDTITNLFFKKGAFIIPFVGDQFNDTLITAVVYDYNQTHELDNQSIIKNEVYILMEEIDVNCNKLNEPKIAQHFGLAIRYGWPTYLQISEDGGFLNYELLLDEETYKTLNNQDFNVFIWPYLPSIATFYEQFLTFINLKEINSIRSFINNGGGYLGTCYGAYAASSGFVTPMSLLSLLYANNPDLKQIIPVYSVSMSDSLMKINLDAYLNFYISIQKVVDTNHPVFFGVNETIKDFLNSPIFAWIGKNTNVLAKFYDIEPNDENSKVSNRLKRILVGRASWVNSTFGKGKMVLYDSHPDFVNNITPLFINRTWEGDKFYGRRIIHNSILFVSYNDKISPLIFEDQNLSYIDSIFEKTNNLPINGISNNEFGDLLKRLDDSYTNFTFFKIKIVNLRDSFLDLENKSDLFAKGSRLLRYAYWLSEIFQDYINKTKKTLFVLDQVIPMLSSFNNFSDTEIKFLKEQLSYRINESDKTFNKIIKIAKSLEENLSDPKISVIQKINLLNCCFWKTRINL